MPHTTRPGRSKHKPQKRHETTDADGWIHVSRAPNAKTAGRRLAASTLKGDAMPALVPERGLTLEKLRAEYDSVRQVWISSVARKGVQAVLRRRFGRQEDDMLGTLGMALEGMQLDVPSDKADSVEDIPQGSRPRSCTESNAQGDRAPTDGQPRRYYTISEGTTAEATEQDIITTFICLGLGSVASTHPRTRSMIQLVASVDIVQHLQLLFRQPITMHIQEPRLLPLDRIFLGSLSISVLPSDGALALLSRTDDESNTPSFLASADISAEEASTSSAPVKHNPSPLLRNQSLLFAPFLDRAVEKFYLAHALRCAVYITHDLSGFPEWMERYQADEFDEQGRRWADVVANTVRDMTDGFEAWRIPEFEGGKEALDLMLYLRRREGN